MELSPLLLHLLLAIGLGFFFGLAFEEFHHRDRQARPGGVRTFPLLALTGASLYLLDSNRLLPFAIGLMALCLWLAVYYWQHCTELDDEGLPNVGIVVPVCNVLVYVIGAVSLAEPEWATVGITVAAVLFLTARERLHSLARSIELSEIVTAGKFLILTGLILPLLPNTPVTDLTSITPHQVWLAVLAVCTLSYGSYLLQRYVAPANSGLWTAVLGGLYSSTATTVVLARRARAEPKLATQAQAGITLATAIMYLRILIITAVFNRSLALQLTPSMIVLALIGVVAAGLQSRREGSGSQMPSSAPTNPLELNAALVFAVLFVVISIAARWVVIAFGARGVDILAAIVGLSDIDPFVLSIAQGSAQSITIVGASAAILIAASSNNLLKATYSLFFAGYRTALAPAIHLGALALLGFGYAAFLTLY